MRVLPGQRTRPVFFMENDKLYTEVSVLKQSCEKSISCSIRLKLVKAISISTDFFGHEQSEIIFTRNSIARILHLSMKTSAQRCF